LGLYSEIAYPLTVFEDLLLHDALPISDAGSTRASHRATGQGPTQARKVRGRTREVRALVLREVRASVRGRGRPRRAARGEPRPTDRKSTRLNSSHVKISYAVFCLKKKK